MNLQQRRWIRWGLAFGFWTFLAVVYSAQAHFLDRSLGGQLAFHQEVIPAFVDWYSWWAVSPAILWLTRVFRIGAGRWPVSTMVMLVTGAIVALVKVTITFLTWDLLNLPIMASAVSAKCSPTSSRSLHCAAM